MVSKVKLYNKLDALELELEERLVLKLENAAKGNNELAFCVPAFNPYKALKTKTDTQMQELVELGAQVLALRSKLGESSESTIAERICWYCREWGSLENYHHGRAQELAQKFLAEINNAAHKA